MKNIDKILFNLNTKAIKNGDVPVSCIIIKNNIIISKAYNMRVKNNDPFAHAEILAIKKAAKKLGTNNLKDCILYCSLKPCKMCEWVIFESRIKKVYYILDKEKVPNINIKLEKINNIYDEIFKNQLIAFFKDKR